MIIIIALLLIILGFLSIWFRHQVANLAGTTVDYTIGTWYRIWPAVRRALIVGGIGWGILIVLMAGIGAYANSLMSALLISIIFPFWFISMLIPRRTVPSPIKWKIPILGIIRFFGGIILLVSSLMLTIGLWSPAAKGSLNRWSGNKKIEIANSINKSSLESEAEMGKFAKVAEDSQIYNQSGQPVFFVQKGTIIMIEDLDGKKASIDSEGMTKVMCSDRHGDFQKGNNGWIPTRKLDWKWKETITIETNVAGGASNEAWKLCWIKPAGYRGKDPEKNLCGVAEVKKEGKILVINFHPEKINNPAILSGVSIDGKSFHGVWEDKLNRGEFFLDFISEVSAVGYYTDEGSIVHVTMLMTKI